MSGNLQFQVEQQLLKMHTPAAVLLNRAKEELQSLNEELYTLNAELQSKVDDLSLVNSDMKNLLNSTDIATIFLDNVLHIRRFTTPATTLYKLIASDVQRPLSDIVNDLEYPELEADALEVLRTLMFSEKQVATRDGRWYTVRIMPYRTSDNVIDGVVLIFINITESKRLETQLRLLTEKVYESGNGGGKGSGNGSSNGSKPGGGA